MSPTGNSSATTAPSTHPTHLDPSELGTKEYWDTHYTEDLKLTDDDRCTSSSFPPPSPSDLASWFDDVDAPARTLAFLTSPAFPLSPTYTTNEVVEASLKSPPSVLDLGTGNGSTLFQLRLSGNFSGPMLGVDYSPKSIQLARVLAKRYASTNPAWNKCATIQFEVLDLIHDDPTTQPWWPSDAGGFDLVLDKGTFDAISLSSEVISSANGRQRQACEVYPGRVVEMIKPGGFLLLTSCNWTEEEVLHWFTKSEGTLGRLQVWGNVNYPKYKFGGQEGQGVASICFRRVG